MPPTRDSYMLLPGCLGVSLFVSRHSPCCVRVCASQEAVTLDNFEETDDESEDNVGGGGKRALESDGTDESDDEPPTIKPGMDLESAALSLLMKKRRV